MKKLFFIAILALAGMQTSCSNDSETVTPIAKVTPLQDDFSAILREDDTLSDGDTGGQGGNLPPTKP
jgi:hypothetical protein